MQRRMVLRYGEFDSVDHLAERIIEFIVDYNTGPDPSAGPTTDDHYESRNSQ